MSDTSFHPEIETLMAEFARSGVRELHLRCGEFELYLSNDPNAEAPAGVVRNQAAPQAPAPRPLASPAPAPVPEAYPADAFIVRAPNLGTFYRSPKPGAPAYIEQGSVVAAGDELCLIEVMKLFTAVRAEIGGRVHSILAPDGVMVEAGQPLFAIVRD